MVLRKKEGEINKMCVKIHNKALKVKSNKMSKNPVTLKPQVTINLHARLSLDMTNAGEVARVLLVKFE